MQISVGDVFSDLTIEAVEQCRPNYAVCRCACGNTKRVRFDHLRTGKIRSCGCLRNRLSRERTSARPMGLKHGKSRSRVYNIWMGMRQRCYNPNNIAYEAYGGRGILICERWQHFPYFYADMGNPPRRHEIERIDNDSGYSPENCKWATRREQQNNRRGNRTITIDGVTRTVAEWSELTGIHHNTIAQRLDRGRPPADIVAKVSFRTIKGLALGGKANGARLAARTHCKYGHPFDAENSYFNGKQRVCRACRRRRNYLVTS